MMCVLHDSVVLSSPMINWVQLFDNLLCRFSQVLFWNFPFLSMIHLPWSFIILLSVDTNVTIIDRSALIQYVLTWQCSLKFNNVRSMSRSQSLIIYLHVFPGLPSISQYSSLLSIIHLPWSFIIILSVGISETMTRSLSRYTHHYYLYHNKTK